MRGFSAGRLNLLCELGLVLVFVALGIHTVSTSRSARAQLADVRRAQRISDAYQEARLDVFSVETLARRYVSSPDPDVRREFDDAVDAAFADFETIRQVGAPADRQFADNIIKTGMPAFRVVQEFFRSLETGSPFNGELPTVDMSTRIRTSLDDQSQDRLQSANGMLVAQEQAQADRLRVTLAAYGTGLALVAGLFAAARVLGNRDAQRRAEIAERQRSLELLRESEERYRQLVEASPVAMVVQSGGVVIYGNAALARLLGAEDPASFAGMQITDVVPSERRDAVRERIGAALLSGASILPPFEERIVHANGELIPVEISVAMTTLNGKPMSVAALRDLSAQKKAEEQRLVTERAVLEAQKLESLAVLAGGVAHDFNNLLVGILGNASLAADELPAGSPTREVIRDIELAAHRAAALARQMLAYSGKGRFVVERIDINALIEETAHLALASTTRRSTLTFDLADGIPAIDGDATQLRQVIMNLVINAADAVGERDGEITVSTRLAHLDGKALEGMRRGEELREGDYVRIEVTDTGAGMSPEVEARAFEPFFTTKFSGRGLGLSAVMGIVRGHAGTIRVDSKVGVGTTFAVFLPCAAPKAEPADTPAADRPAQAGIVGTVLVIDDEAVVRTTMTRALQALGFGVLTAVDGQDGVETFAAHPDDVACVLVDLTMPRMSGDEAFCAIRAIRPDARVVIMSGYDEQDMVERLAGQRPAGFLHKPFGLDTLSEVIGRATEATPQSPP